VRTGSGYQDEQCIVTPLSLPVVDDLQHT
jgi:hypothetical protein